ncbi:restriction endonuclease subunit S [Thiocapsa bogorovii]|uniref:restriction endonuclease subunit S n=1 Tax=Thiocapsa bogorovii TaxID=521689 RepID=UPI001E65B6DC|nr:restriction endonuclease subunit S [Thiocapsa bogorovii]UHD18313.1 restriction endonuclease subunit S [Thiocapsa bogorovii]
MSWAKRNFEELVEFHDHERIPLSTLVRETRQGEYPYYGAQGIIDSIDDFIFDGEYVLIAEDGANLVTRKEPTARVVHGQFWVNNHAHVVRARKGIATNRFLNLLLNHSDLRGYVTGAAQPKLSQGNLRKVTFLCPSYQEQLRIEAVVSEYDDLIENNRRRMALLEEAARQLYREWFVRLRFPGHEHTRIIDGLPEGWERRSLNDLAEFQLGKMLDARKNRGELRPYLANINVRWGQIDLSYLREMPFEEHEIDKYGLRYGDIVMCEGGEPGRCAIWKGQAPGMMFQKAIHRIRAAESFDHHFLYYSLYYKGISGQLAGLFTGATIKHLPREKLAKVDVKVPPRRLIGLFSEHVGPIEQQIGILQAAARRATEARDLLLPRLMSGEIAV